MSRLDLEQTYEVERNKWDAIADSESFEATALPQYANFEDYARQSSRLVGVSDFLGDLRGKSVLDYGCGLGKSTVLLALSGARVSAFDISPRSVQIARRRAEANGLEADIVVAAGEDLPYSDNSFDIVFGAAILHHLDPHRGWGELYRVLKPGGRAAFVEPMGMNPLLTFVRDHVPYRQKTQRGADRPLTYREIEMWGKGFTQFHHQEIQLVSMVQRLFGYRKRFDLLHRLDMRLLTAFPFLRRYCRYVVMYMVK